jgi:catechol 2,3-dioxygenase
MTMQDQQQQQQTAATPAASSIAPATQVGIAGLTVADLDREVAFYTDALGFQLLERREHEAILGAGGRPVLALRHLPGADLAPERATGLYHFAILLPTRADLGRWLRHWLEAGFGVPGQGDHLVSEALYLSDPEGNGIEIYRDRPRDEWTWDGGQVRMATDPVDLRGVLADADREGKSWTGMPAGTRIGHMHLKVGDIARAEAFYHDVLGFDIVARMPSALFVSAGGYHHHIGMNTWHSRGAGPAPEGSTGLRFFSLELPDEAARAAVVARLDAAGIAHTEAGNAVLLRDPWQNVILLHIGPAADAAAAGALADALA